ncbi:MAG TPA: TspO/MBR family protein [Mycobacterium sp.]|nr:TspO/MBR family protein [Mycobacterium sp.]
MRISTLGITAASVATAAAVGGLASRTAVRSRWFDRLEKPTFQPPDRAFGIVWPMLYADIAVVSADTVDTLRDSGRRDEANAYAAALAANLVLNASWTWLFFNRHWLGISSVAAAALAVSSADLTRRSVAVRGARAFPLAAYPAWCAFATVLSTTIWRRNRRH